MAEPRFRFVRTGKGWECSGDAIRLFIVTFVLSFSPPGPGGAPGDTVTVSPARSTRPESDLRHYGVWCMNGVWTKH